MDQNIPKKGHTYKHYDYFEHGQLRYKYVIKGKKLGTGITINLKNVMTSMRPMTNATKIINLQLWKKTEQHTNMYTN